MRKYIYMALFSILFFSCVKDNNMSGMGSVNFGVKVGTEDVIIRTKSVTDNADVYRLIVTNSKDEVVSRIEELSNENNTIQLLAKNYHAKVTSGTLVNSDFDMPYYIGEQDFTVIPNENRNIDLKVKLGNIKVSIEYSPELMALLSNANTDVKIESKNGLTFVKDEIRAGYFKPIKALNKINWTLALTPIFGDSQELSGEVPEIKANDHLIIRFTLKEDDGSSTGGIRILPIILVEDVVKIDEDLNVDIPTFPSIKLLNGDINEEQTVIAAGPEAMVINIEAGSINSLNMTYKCNYLKSALNGRETIDILLNNTQTEPTVVNDFILEGVNIEYLPAKGECSNPIRITLTSDFLKKIDVSSENEGLYEFKFDLKDNAKRKVTRTLLFSKINSDVLTIAATSHDRWATKLDVKGRWIDTQPAVLSFEYKKDGGLIWNEIDQSEINVNTSTKTFSATIFNLEASTQYVVRAKGVSVANSIKIGTVDEVQLYNEGLNLWSKEGNAWYVRENSSFAFWDSANKSASIISNPTEPETTDKVEGTTAAKLTSKDILGNFAAGNLFAGELIGVNISTQVPDMIFGRPFTSRPSALSGFYKYKSIVINKAGGGKESFQGRPDRFSMIVILAGEPRHINEKNKSPYDIETIMETGTDGTTRAIASGFLTSEAFDKEGNDITPLLVMEEYEKFRIDLKYHEANKNLDVKYIIVIFSASKYGDYFTGGVGSCLLIDDLKLHYDFKK